jgi:hypothetical protein
MTFRAARNASALVLAFTLALPAAGFADDHRPPPPPRQDMHGSDRGHDQGPPQRHGQGSMNRPPRGHPEFNADQSGFARDYYRSHKWDAPRPPHRLYVGYRLSRRYWHPLPPEFQHRFRARPGYGYYMAGDDIVLVALATGLIVDILVNVH